MAKHKKKKSPPTPDSNESKEEKPTIDEEKPQIKDEGIPPTEKDDKPKASPVSETQTPETKRKLDRLFWLRVGLAVLAGIAATFIFEPIEDMEERRWTSIGFMIVIFILSCFIGKGMNLQLPRSDRKKLVTTGIGSYIFIYLFVWIISYSLVYFTGNGGDIPTPFT